MNEESNVMEEYVPASRSKRIMAWILFAVMCVGIIFWLLGIACPTWVDTAKEWMRNTF